MTDQHTPGPWEVQRMGSKQFIWDCAPYPGSVPIAEVIAGRYVGEKARNARLIAAAPDLLTALNGLFEHCAMVHKHWGDGNNQKEADAAIAAARAAIAAATGES